MKVEVILKCLGIYFIYFIIFMISGLFIHGYILKFFTVFLMGGTTYFIQKKYKFSLIRPLKKKVSLIVIPFFVGVGVSFINIISIMPLILKGEEYFAPNLENYFLYIIFVAAASIAEEIFFRGVFLNICKPHSTIPITILVPAILFALNHLHPRMMLHTFIGGLIFGYFYYYSENIFVPIIIHLTTNLMWATLLAGLLVETLSVKVGIIPAAMIFILVGVVIVISMMFIYKKICLKEN